MAKRELFLSQVYRHHKKLFWGMVFFAGCTLLTNLSGDEITPFFVWGMYSEKEAPAEHYDILKITVNDTTPVDYSSGPANTLFFLRSPLSYYIEMVDNNNEDPTVSFLKTKLKNYYRPLIPLEGRIFNTAPEQSGFMEWYQQYLEGALSLDTRKIQIDRLQVSFNSRQEIILDSAYTWGIWKTHQ